jgi:hypothetical protein
LENTPWKTSTTCKTSSVKSSRHARAQAIADGALIDVTAQASETGFKVPVAVTADTAPARHPEYS